MNHTQADNAYKNIIHQIDNNIVTLNNFKFLVEATSILLSSSMDYEETLSQVSQLAVPNFADWCTVHIVEEDGVEQISVAHVDPAKVKFAKELQEKYPSDPNSNQGIHHVIRTGTSEIIPVIPEKLLLASARDDEHKKLIKELCLKSYMCVPLIARQKVLGAMTFISAESEKMYTENDLYIVEDLARIAAVAVDNALLFKSAQDEIKKREKAEQEVLILNKNLEQKVEIRTEELRRSNRELQDFAYVASHDLQEPLRKIQSFGNLLADEAPNMSDDGKMYVNRMLDAALRMRKLIDDLLSFSRITTKAQPFEKVDLKQITTDVITDLESHIKDLNAQLEVDDLMEIEADPVQMRQLVQNLISNALKFHKQKENPHIKISSSEVRHEGKKKICQLIFKDNGIGIHKKYHQRIFTLFERLHGRKDYEGTGIGLSVVKKIVERHHGTIKIESNEGEGTAIIINLPITQSKGGES